MGRSVEISSGGDLVLRRETPGRAPTGAGARGRPGRRRRAGPGPGRSGAEWVGQRTGHPGSMPSPSGSGPGPPVASSCESRRPSRSPRPSAAVAWGLRRTRSRWPSGPSTPSWDSRRRASREGSTGRTGSRGHRGRVPIPGRRPTRRCARSARRAACRPPPRDSCPPLPGAGHTARGARAPVEQGHFGRNSEEAFRVLGLPGLSPPQVVAALQVRAVGAGAAEELHQVCTVGPTVKAWDVTAEELGQPHEGHRKVLLGSSRAGPWPARRPDACGPGAVDLLRCVPSGLAPVRLVADRPWFAVRPQHRPADMTVMRAGPPRSGATGSSGPGRGPAPGTRPPRTPVWPARSSSCADRTRPGDGATRTDCRDPGAPGSPGRPGRRRGEARPARSAGSIGATGSVRRRTLASPPRVMTDEPTKAGLPPGLDQESNALQDTIKCRPARRSPVRLAAGKAPISVLPHEHQEEALHGGQPAGAPDRRLVGTRVHVEEA